MAKKVYKKSVEEEAIEKFGSLIKSIANTYNSLPSYMDSEDLVRVGEWLVSKMIMKHGHLSESDFERYFKRSLKNKFNTIVNSIHTKGRNPIKEVRIYVDDDGRCDQQDGDCFISELVLEDKSRGLGPNLIGTSQREGDPSKIAETKETLTIFRSKLSTDEVKLFDLFLDPPESLHEIVEKSLKASHKTYHTVLPFYVIHEAMGWKSEGYTRSILKSLRLKYLEHLEMFDLMIENFPAEFPVDLKEEL